MDWIIEREDGKVRVISPAGKTVPNWIAGAVLLFAIIGLVSIPRFFFS